MPITSNNPVGPVDSLSALKALLRQNSGVNGGHDPISLNAADPGGVVQNTANRDARLTQMKHNLGNTGTNFGTGATRGDIMDLGQDIAEDPFTGVEAHQDVDKEENLNRVMQEYNRPDVTEQRTHGEQYALQRLLMPLQVKGQYEVAAAQAKANNTEESDMRKIHAASDLQGQRDTALMDRAQQNSGAITNRQRVHDISTGKAHAARPGGLMDSLFGPSQSSLDQAEVANLSAGGGADGGGMVSMHAPDGRPLRVPAHKVNEMEAAGAVRD